MCGFAAQLVEHRTGVAEVTGSNPVQALIFFRLLPSNCLNWKIYCGDHSSLSSTTAMQYEFHIYFTVIGDIRDLLSERHASEKNRNRKILLSIPSNIRYFERQALPLRGNCLFFSLSFYAVIMHTISCLINSTRSLNCDSFISGIPICRKCSWYFCEDFWCASSSPSTKLIVLSTSIAWRNRNCMVC